MAITTNLETDLHEARLELCGALEDQFAAARDSATAEFSNPFPGLPHPFKIEAIGKNLVEGTVQIYRHQVNGDQPALMAPNIPTLLWVDVSTAATGNTWILPPKTGRVDSGDTGVRSAIYAYRRSETRFGDTPPTLDMLLTSVPERNNRNISVIPVETDLIVCRSLISLVRGGASMKREQIAKPPLGIPAFY